MTEKILYSNIFVNNIYLGCKYSKLIENNLENIIKNSKGKCVNNCITAYRNN